VTATREVGAGQGQGEGQKGHGKLPVYQLHYAVYYNATDDEDHGSTGWLQTSTIVPDNGQKASNVCARHYAETFLIRLLTLESWLNDLCSNTTQRPSASPRVVVHTVVVVRNYGSHVSTVTDSERRVVGHPGVALPLLA